MKLIPIVCCFIGLSLAACSSGDYVRHLASDACLVTPQQSTRKDLLDYLGQPDNRLTGAEGEKWIYYQRHKSLLRRTPYVGDKLGSEDYDVLIVTLNGNRVKSCIFRMFDEREFKESNFPNKNSLDKK